MHSLLLTLHVLAAVVWVGGMFFAYLILRPASTSLSLAERLPLWAGVFARFFLWVWLAIGMLLVTGYAMLFGYLGGFAGAGAHVHLMQAIGWVMFLVFGHVYFSPWQRLRAALGVGSLDQAAHYLNQIRIFVGINLLLGLVTIAIAVAG